MVTLRLDKNGGINKGDIKIIETDNKSEVYIIQLYKENEVYDLTGKTIELNILEKKRSYGDTFELPIYEATTGKVKLEVVEGMTKTDGLFYFQITVKDSTGLVDNFPTFLVDIKNSIKDDITGAIIESPQFKILTDAIEKAENVVNEVETDYNSLKKVIIDENASANLQNQINVIGELLDTKAEQSGLEIERNRITNLATLQQGSTTGDAELIDIRVGIDGETYANAGEAVRSQFEYLTDIIDMKKEKNITGFKIGLCIFVSEENQSVDDTNKTRITKIYLKKDFNIESGVIIGFKENSAYSVYNFAIGTNKDSNWILDSKNSAYHSEDYTFKTADIEKANQILIKRVDSATMTEEDLTYINNNFIYNKGAKTSLKEKVINKENLNFEIKNTLPSIKKFHLSFDDVDLSLLDLYNNKDKYNSIFENAFFGMLKEFHDKYGLVVSCYTYNTNVKFINDIFKKEFKENSKWLKFGFHCESGGEDYSVLSPSQAKTHYDKFITNIYAMCGEKDCVDRLPRLNYFKGSIESLNALNECDCGIIGCLSADDNRNTYYFNQDQIDYMRVHDKLNDYTTGLVFYSTDIRLDWWVDGFTSQYEYDKPTLGVYEELVKRYNMSKYSDSFNTLIVFGHEWQVYKPSSNTLNETFKTYIESALKFATDYGYNFDFPMNFTNSITKRKYITKNNIYYNIECELTFEKGAIDGDGNIVESTTRIVSKNNKFENAKKITINIPSDCKINYAIYDKYLNNLSVSGWQLIESLNINLETDKYYSIALAKRTDEVINNVLDIGYKCILSTKI